MSARENLLRKSCRAPANNHFIYVSHRQHSCGKKDLYQRFVTTDENVTLSANTRLPSFLAGRQSAVLSLRILRGFGYTLVNLIVGYILFRVGKVSSGDDSALVIFFGGIVVI